LFGVHQIPSVTQARNLLDPVVPATLFPAMAAISDMLLERGHLSAYRSIGGTFLVALDGTDFFFSQNISCPCCSTAKLAGGATQYRHIAVTPVIYSRRHRSCSCPKSSPTPTLLVGRMMLCDIVAQGLIHSRLPAWAGGAEKGQHSGLNRTATCSLVSRLFGPRVRRAATVVRSSSIEWVANASLQSPGWVAGVSSIETGPRFVLMFCHLSC
jgi:hypothetical protein